MSVPVHSLRHCPATSPSQGCDYFPALCPRSNNIFSEQPKRPFAHELALQSGSFNGNRIPTHTHTHIQHTHTHTEPSILAMQIHNCRKTFCKSALFWLGCSFSYPLSRHHKSFQVVMVSEGFYASSRQKRLMAVPAPMLQYLPRLHRDCSMKISWCLQFFLGLLHSQWRYPSSQYKSRKQEFKWNRFANAEEVAARFLD